MSTTRIGVAGITGKLGSLVARNLLSHPSAHVQGFCRDKSKLPDSIRSNPKVSTVEGDSSNLEAARSAVRGCSAVICCYLGSNDLMIDGQKVLIDACIAEKVPRYIPSDYTLDYRPLQPTDIPSKEPMFRIIEYLEGKPIKGVHILIGAFVQTWWTFLGIWHPKEYKLNFWGTGDEKWEFSTYNNAAQYIAEVALDSSASGFLKFRGDFISTKEIAKLLQNQYGDMPQMQSKGSLESLRAACDEARKGNSVSYQNLPLFYSYYIQTGKAYMGDDLDNDRYPNVKPESMEDFLKANDVRKMQVW
ncbi:MAG: hypothetical protein M1830_008988 [Pleopsidium flavum]|nr:MAG: hypothetical protein M1830_008988 [Pleopsidium flavum]